MIEILLAALAASNGAALLCAGAQWWRNRNAPLHQLFPELRRRG